MRKSIAAAVIAASAATSACGHDRSEGAGPTVSRNYQVGNFQAIEVAGPYDVQVRTGANPSVSASGGEKPARAHRRGDPWRQARHSPGGATRLVPLRLGNERQSDFHGHRPAAQRGDASPDRATSTSTRYRATASKAPSPVQAGSLLRPMDVQSLKLSIAGSGGVKAGTGKAQIGGI